jgi:ABC-2 type transport system permease protein
MDILVGDESFVSLRNKRVRHRTLERVEAQTREFKETRVREEEEAEADAERALAEAQQTLDRRVEEVQSRPELDERTKQIMARNIQEVESRKFEVLKASIEAEKEAKVNASRESLESQLRRIQSNIKTFAVLLPPIPVFIIGILIFLRRRRREREGESVARLLRG